MTTAIDVFDLRVYEHGIPYDAFARLRDEAPVSWQDPRSRAALTDMFHISGIKRMPARFTPGRRLA